MRSGEHVSLLINRDVRESRADLWHNPRDIHRSTP
jgi:hypothetical protein